MIHLNVHSILMKKYWMSSNVNAQHVGRRRLANGTLQTVREIVCNENKTSIEFPDYVMVPFDNYKGSCINENLFSVARITRFCEKNGRKITRKQFPLKVAYAIRIYKSQGLTLELIVIDCN